MKTILHIDDDLFIRDLVATKLNNDKYQVISAANAKEGLMALSDNKPDLILLDLELPDRSGLDVLKQFKADSTSSSIPVVVFSNKDDEEVKKTADENGAAGFFLKVQIDMSELEALVDKFAK